MQSVPITTKVVSCNPIHSEVYLVQHYVIKFVSDLRQVGSFLRVHRFPPPLKTDSHDITEILLKVVLNTINPNQTNMGLFQVTFFPFIFDLPISYVRHLKINDQSNNRYQCVLGYTTSRLGRLITDWSVKNMYMYPDMTSYRMLLDVIV